MGEVNSDGEIFQASMLFDRAGKKRNARMTKRL